MINNQRLGYKRLAEVLVERELVEAQAVQDALSMGAHGGLPFPEALVAANLVADWELSRIVCELYGMPFLTVDMCDPDPSAQRDLDLTFLIDHGLIPLCRYGQVLTICMPAVVPAEVLGLMAAETNLLILPVVGTVQSNRRWIDTHFSEAPVLPGAGGEEIPEDSDWSNLFDEADAAVLSDLEFEEPVPPDEPADAAALSDPEFEELVPLDEPADATVLSDPEFEELVPLDEPADATVLSDLDIEDPTPPEDPEA